MNFVLESDVTLLTTANYCFAIANRQRPIECNLQQGTLHIQVRLIKNTEGCGWVAGWVMAGQEIQITINLVRRIMEGISKVKLFFVGVELIIR